MDRVVAATIHSRNCIGVSSMNIYSDPIADALGIRNIHEIFPDWEDIEPDHAINMHEGLLNPFYGKKHSEETKELLRSAWQKTERRKHLEKLHTPEVAKKISTSVQAWYDNASVDEVKAKTSNGLNKMNSYVECPHCGIKTNRGNIGKYHGDKCKEKK